MFESEALYAVIAVALFSEPIRWGDGDMLFDLFTRTRGIRRSIIDAGQETDAPDFGRHAKDGTSGPAE